MGQNPLLQPMPQPYGQQDVSLDDLRHIRDFLGIQSGSPIDSGVKSVLSAPGKAISGMQQAGQGALDALTKAPALPAQQTTPTGMASPSAPPAEQLPRRDPTQFELPTFLDPSQTTTGHASYNGPQLNNEGALAGLKNTQMQRETESQANYIPSEELWKQGFRNPEQMAPGAGQWAGHELQERLGDQDFEKGLQQKSRSDIASAETSLNPIVQAGANAQAQRAALPSRLNADAAVEVAKLRNQDPYLNALAKTLSTGGAGNLKSMSRSGFTLQSDPNMAPYYNALVQAHKTSGGLFGGNQQLQQAQQNFINAYPFHGTNPARMKQVLQQSLLNPNAEIAIDDLSPEDEQELQTIYGVLTGEALQ